MIKNNIVNKSVVFLVQTSLSSMPAYSTNPLLGLTLETIGLKQLSHPFKKIIYDGQYDRFIYITKQCKTFDNTG